MNMTSPEKYLFVADIVFALLSLWFFFPRCKLSLWTRLILAVFVLGINLWFFQHDNNVTWLFNHQDIYSALCIWVIFTAVFGWKANREDAGSWHEWANQFEQKHQRLLWGIVIAMLLLIPIVVYWILH
jgi:hypothetical protein